MVITIITMRHKLRIIIIIIIIMILTGEDLADAEWSEMVQV